MAHHYVGEPDTVYGEFWLMPAHTQPWDIQYNSYYSNIFSCLSSYSRAQKFNRYTTFEVYIRNKPLECEYRNQFLRLL